MNPQARGEKRLKSAASTTTQLETIVFLPFSPTPPILLPPMTAGSVFPPRSRSNEPQTETSIGTTRSLEDEQPTGAGPLLFWSIIVYICLEVSQVVTAGKTPWAADLLKIAAIIILLVYSINHASPQFPDIEEWAACDKHLGEWNLVWVLKRMCDPIVAVWVWKRGGLSKGWCVFSGTLISPLGVLTLFRNEPLFLTCHQVDLDHCLQRFDIHVG